MFNILFWNIKKNQIEDYITRCIAENDVDVALFTEYNNVDFSKILNSLGGKYVFLGGIQKKTKIAIMYKNMIRVNESSQ